MGAAIQIVGGLMAQRSANNEAVIAEKTAQSEQLTEGYNSAQRQRDRIKQYRVDAAERVARGGAGGVDAFSGSIDQQGRHSAGNLKFANYEDVFSTTNKRQQITSAGKWQSDAARQKGRASLIKSFGEAAKSYKPPS